MWLAWLATTTSVVYAYVVSPSPLVWHLMTSVDRTTIASRMILLAECLVWSSAAVAALRRPSARVRVDDQAPHRRDEARVVAELPAR
jgi:hypothetical protein